MVYKAPVCDLRLKVEASIKMVLCVEVSKASVNWHLKNVTEVLAVSWVLLYQCVKVSFFSITSPYLSAVEHLPVILLVFCISNVML
jgi:hypothetical protein